MIVGGIAATLRDQNRGWLSDIFVTRLTGSGLIDSTFGFNGIAIVDVGLGAGSAYAYGIHIAKQADGNVAIAANGAVTAGGWGHLITSLVASGSYAGLLGFTSVIVDTSETAGSIAIPVRRTAGSSGPVSVDYATSVMENSFATSGADFTSTTGTLTWATATPRTRSSRSALPPTRSVKDMKASSLL